MDRYGSDPQEACHLWSEVAVACCALCSWRLDVVPASRSVSSSSTLVPGTGCVNGAPGPESGLRCEFCLGRAWETERSIHRFYRGRNWGPERQHGSIDVLQPVKGRAGREPRSPDALGRAQACGGASACREGCGVSPEASSKPAPGPRTAPWSPGPIAAPPAKCPRLALRTSRNPLPPTKPPVSSQRASPDASTP